MTTDGFEPAALLAEINEATAQVLASAERLSAEHLAGPSLLPGWSRGHVLTHLARNADALTNLLNWARTGIPTPMYPPGDARDRAIEEGAGRPAQEQLTDLYDASGRFAQAFTAMTPTAWGAKVTARNAGEIAATTLPAKRLRELYIHHVDLDAGWTPAHWPTEYADRELNEVAASFRGRPDCPPLLLRDDITHRELLIGPEGVAPAAVVSGRRQSLLAWLIGRANGDGLSVEPAGPLPTPPAWM
ncbi:maleylpyruvate isomerase family mycothiol-dependent enzyme [Embleya sp. NPDC056575]|uniref:maleylpyruvate isomerase family mycothiol-dependent enzyme n=1 Tax=unclassified Embleya TaxID=2699296 RepID=UPI00367D2707